MNNSSSIGLLQKLNDEKAILLIPVLVFIGVLMVTGFIGNIFICYFYGCKTKTTATSCFILGLAIFDLMSITVSMPMEIVDIRFFYMFPDVWVCKVLRTINFICAISSGLILIAIAVERYRRICLPFRRQITVFQARLICFISFLISCVFSWPNIALYSIVPINVTTPGSGIIQGYDCTTVKDQYLKIYLDVFNVIQILLFAFAVVSLTVLYVLVCRELIRLNHFRVYGSEVSHENNAHTATNTDAFRYTKLMLVITGTFTVSFLPYICLAVWRNLSKGYEINNMTDLQLIFYSIGIRSYFFNCAINPMIYGYFNSQFRTFFVRVCCACRGPKPSCIGLSGTTCTFNSRA